MNETVLKARLAEFNAKHNVAFSDEDYKTANAEIGKIGIEPGNSNSQMAFAALLGEPFAVDNLDYSPIARSIFTNKTIDGAEVYKQWKKSNQATAYVMANSGEIRRIKKSYTSFTVTYYPLTSEQVEVPIMDMITTGLDIVADAKTDVAHALDQKEDLDAIALLDAAVTASGHTSNTAADHVYGIADFKFQWKQLRVHCTPATLLMHPDRAFDFFDWDNGITNGIWKENRERVLASGNLSFPIFPKIITNEQVNENYVYMLGAPAQIGWFFTLPNEGRRRTPIVTFGMNETNGNPTYYVYGYEVIGMALRLGEGVSRIIVTQN